MGQRETAAPRFSACLAHLGQRQNTARRSRLSVICQSIVTRPDRRTSGLTSPNNLAKIVWMKRVKIGEFRDRASELIRRAAGGETVVILNRDREVAKIVPITAKTARAGGLVGSLAGTAEVRGDIEAPIAPADAWFRKPS
jgi:antitoxin (DNA-binding transcriptional repressor) of toxin-antitoxin stability system